MPGNAVSRLIKTAAAFAALAVCTGTALAHAWLESSVPAANGALAPDSKEITLTFDEVVKPVSCKLTDSAGKEAAVLGKASASGETLHVPLTARPAPGKYSLTCRVVGPDTHAVNGALSFIVGNNP